MSRTNDWNRAETALMRRGKPDCVPLWEIFVDIDVREAFLGRKIVTLADEVEFWREAGYDFIPVSAGLLAVGEVAQETAIHHTERYGVYGDGQRDVTWAVEGEGVITTWEQFEAYPWPTPEQIAIEQIAAHAALLPEGMAIAAVIGKIFTAVWMLMGFEGFAEAVVHGPDLLAAVFEKVGSIQYGVCKRCMEEPRVGALLMSDDIAYGQGLMVNPRILREHLFPWYRKLGRELNARGIPYVYHSDGDLWPVMGDILDCGFNALHPIEPKGMDSREVKAKFGDRLCILGNIDLDRLSRGTPAEAAEMVKRNIDALAYDGGYCVGSSNSVTYFVPLANYVAMIETAKEYGGR
jgi:uroporphyrinogen decarboxylase